MRLFGRRKPKSPEGTLDRAADGEDTAALKDFVKSREGVEAFVEPATTMTSTTMLLVAHDGEWTRRRIRDPQAAEEFARKLEIPVYDAQIVGYPPRMREYNRRLRERKK
ncbi:MAG TPA: hypothetical protein VFZ37_20430 [Jiangellaceae bacterium]